MKGVFVSLLLFCLVACDGIPQYVRRGHFVGRSGNVVVLPIENTRAPPSLLLMDLHRQHYPHTDSIEDVNVANLISHIFQSTPPSNEKDLLSIDRSHFPAVSLFSAPAANVFISIEDVDRHTLEKFPTLSLLQNRKQVDITSTYQSRDSLSNLETILSGVTPSEHGIVGRSWMSTSGTESTAFRDSGSGSRSDSIFDVLALTSPQSLIVSMSSNFQVASAIGVRAQKVKTMPNVLSFFWNSKHQNFDSTSGPRGEHPIQSSRADILNSFKEEKFFNFDDITLKYDAKNMQLFVSVRSTRVHAVPFDLNSEEDFRLFVEVFFVEEFMKAMHSEKLQALIKDTTSDSFAFAFDGLRTVKNKYGTNSPQFSAALYLIDRAIKSLLAEISSNYEGKISSQIACHAPIETAQLPNELFQQLEDGVPSVGGLNNFLPDIYMGNELSLSEEKTLVGQMNSFLSESGFIAYWFGRQALHPHDIYLSGHREQHKRSGFFDRKPRVSTFNWDVYKWFGFRFNHSGDTYTLEQVNNYQVTLWTGIALIFIGYSGCCVMCLLDPKKNNELLYLTTALGRETDTIPGGDYDFKPM